MPGTTDLAQLLRDLDPVARPGEYVYTVVGSLADLGGLVPEATVVEDEGLTAVLRREDADRLGLGYDFVAAWITLTVHSALAAVGLTAAFATALGEAGISANVLAGHHHDHVLVPADRRDDALAVLRALGAQDPPGSA